jgi:hypothetical protein
MRKHKSVVAILLAVMMIFTFMPAMAFATVEKGGVKWADDFSSATYNNMPAEIQRTWSNGLITAVAMNPDTGAAISSSAVYYYDFAGASVSLLNSYTNTGYIGLNNKYATITLVRPANVSGGDATYTVTDRDDLLNGWEVKFSTDTTLDNSTDVQAVVKTVIGNNSETTGTADNPKGFNTTAIADKTVNVYGKTTAPKHNFYEIVDGTKVDRTGNYNPAYDGEEHTLLIDPEDGYELTLYEKSYTTGGYVKIDASALTYKDATDPETTKAYRAVYTPLTAAAAQVAIPNAELTVTVRKNSTTNVPTFKWTSDNEVTESESVDYNYYLTEEQAADPTAFIVIDNALGVASTADVDVEELKAVWNELFTVKVTKNVIDESLQTWKIVPVSTDIAKFNKAVAASKKAHSTLFANYKLTNAIDNGPAGIPLEIAGGDTKYVKVKASTVLNDKDDDISFEGQTKYVYSGKKTTKKGVLKKKQTITVNAKADSGNAITYVATKKADGKITISSSGKITLKKGLKKGTYTVTVKAKTAAGNGYKAAKEKETYTIVVKK